MKKLVLLGTCIALTGSAFAGTALINGVTYQNPVTAIPYSGSAIVSDAVDPTVQGQGGDITIGASADGGLDISLNIGRVKGVFDVAGGSSSSGAANVPHNNSGVDGNVNGAGYVFNAGWLVPVDDPLVPNYSSGSDNSRCYVGMQPSAGVLDNNGGYGVFGLEWDTTNLEWDLRSDNDGIWGGGTVSFANPSYFQTRVTRDAAGAVLGQYAVDFGAFQNVPSGFPNPLNLHVIGFGAVDADGDVPAWSWRGRVSASLKASLTTTDAAIADTGIGIDTDGDGVNDENDPWPNNGAWFTDSDNDGLADEWEQANFGDLDEVASGNPDSDADTNVQEFYAGTDPNVGIPVVPTGAPVAGLVGLLALGGALVTAGAVRNRKK